MLVCCSIVAIAQPTVLGTQAQNGSYSTYNLADLGIFRQVRMQATSSGIRDPEIGNSHKGQRLPRIILLIGGHILVPVMAIQI